jgi:hypothetical protein
MASRVPAMIVWNPDASDTSRPTIERACWAADPSHTPSIRVGRPPTSLARGTVQSITVVLGPRLDLMAL